MSQVFCRPGHGGGAGEESARDPRVREQQRVAHGLDRQQHVRRRLPDSKCVLRHVIAVSQTLWWLD